MSNPNQQTPKQAAPRPNPGQIKIPIKAARFVPSFSAPVGFGAGSQIEACSTSKPSSNHTLDFYPESAILRVTWHPPRQPVVSFLVPSIHCFYLAEFTGDDTPKTPQG